MTEEKDFNTALQTAIAKDGEQPPVRDAVAEMILDAIIKDVKN